MNPRLKERYQKEIVQNLMSKLNYKNINAVPKIEKIVLNMGLGQEGLDKKKMEICIKDMSSITGQYPVKTKFKKSISNSRLHWEITECTNFLIDWLILLYQE